MRYNILIEYTSNSSKAGKLTLEDENGGVVLSKVPVAIPNVGEPSYPRLKPLILKVDTALLPLDSGREYREKLENLINTGRGSLIINAADNIVFAPQKAGTDILQADKSVFVVKPEHFMTMFDLLTNPANRIEIKTQQVSFLWFPEKVNRESTDLNLELRNINRIENRLIQQIEAKKPSTPSFTKGTSTKNSAVDLFEKISKTPPKLNKEIAQANLNKAIVQDTNTNTRKRYDDNVDALDVMIMYNYPEIAPFYKPNSMLAWYMYFGREDHQLSRNTIKEEMQNIPGFEGVGNADFKYHPTGYSVTMYEDEQKTKSIGVLTHDKDTGCYEVVSPSGEKTSLKVSDDGLVSGCVSAPDKPVTNFDFVEKDNGFVGNWNSEPSEGVNITSGVSLSPSYHTSSTVGKTVDLDEVVRSNKEAIENPMEGEEWAPPPPPPPPPPSETNNWSSSSDPYSNSSSFKM